VNLINDDFEDLPLGSVLGLILTYAELTEESDHSPFVKVRRGEFGGAIEGDAVEEIGLLFSPLPIHRNAELGDGRSVLGLHDLWVGDKSPGDDHLIQHLTCFLAGVWLSLRTRWASIVASGHRQQTLP